MVGEGGCNPRYFLEDMQWWEVRAYIDGRRQSERIHYYASQWLANAIGSMLSSDSREFPGWGEPWPWNQEKPREISDEEIENARRLLEM